MEMATKLSNVKLQQQQQYESSPFSEKPNLWLVARLFKVSLSLSIRTMLI
jgi:hypothetical protein